MLIKRIEKDDKVKALYESSNILGSTYNKTTKDLTIIFKSGGKYTYHDVKASDYLRFETDDSQGKILNAYIKNHSFTNEGKIDTKEILVEIEKVKEAEVKDFEVEIVTLMDNLSDMRTVSDTNFDIQIVKLLKDKLDKYLELRNGNLND